MKIFLFVVAIFSLISINTSYAQESEFYITSSHPMAQYYYPSDCSLWKVLSSPLVVSFDSVDSLLQEYENRTLHPNCATKESDASEKVSRLEFTYQESEESQIIIRPIRAPINFIESSEIVDGDLIQAYGDIDVYIIKIVGQKRFKRLILNPEVFESYGYLKWSDIKIVSRPTFALYQVSNIVQEINPDGSIANERLYQLFPDGDIGIKRQIELTFDEFIQASGDSDSVYYVNNIEAGNTFYDTNPPINNIEEFREILQEQVQEIEDGVSLNQYTPHQYEDKRPITVLSQPSQPIPLPQPPQEPSPPQTSQEPSLPQTPQGDPPPQPQNPPTSPLNNPTDLGQVGAISLSTDSSTVTLSWGEITGAASYEVQYKKTSESAWKDSSAQVTGGTIKTTTIENLEVGGQYHFQVKAIGDGTNYISGEWSNPTIPTTLLATVGDLAFNTPPPSSLETQVYISWGVIGGATSYEIQLKEGASDSTNSYISQGSVTGATSKTITNLQSGTTYTFQVKAKNAQGEGAWSTQQSHTTSTQLQLPTGLSVSEDSDNPTQGVIVTWTDAAAGQGTITHNVRYRLKTGSWDIPRDVTTIIGATSPEIVGGLTQNSIYIFQVQASDDNGSGDWVDAGEITTGTSLGTTTESVSDITFMPHPSYPQTQVTVSWTAITGTGDIKYNVKYKTKSGNEAWAVIEDITTTSTNVIRGLAPGTTYLFQVQAEKGSVESDWVEEEYTTPLGRVGTITFSRITQTAITLSWDEVTGAEEYEVKHCGNTIVLDCDVDYEWSDATLIDPTQTTQNVVGLTSGIFYNFIVRAKTDDINGLWSREQAKQTRLSIIDRLVFNEQRPPDPQTQVNISWAAIYGAKGYGARYKLGGPNSANPYTGVANIVGGATGILFLNLTPGTTYTFQVKARGSTPDVEGEWTTATHTTSP